MLRLVRQSSPLQLRHVKKMKMIALITSRRSIEQELWFRRRKIGKFGKKEIVGGGGSRGLLVVVVVVVVFAGWDSRKIFADHFYTIAELPQHMEPDPR